MLEDPAAALQKLSAEAGAVARAMALWWTFRTRTAIYDLLRHLQARTANGRAYTQESVKLAQRELQKAGLLVEEDRRQGYWRLADEVRVLLYRQLLEEVPVDRLRDALRQCLPYHHARGAFGWPVWDAGATMALLRLEFLGGADPKVIQEVKLQVGHALDWADLVEGACIEAFDEMLFERIRRPLRWMIAQYALVEVCESWRVGMVPPCLWALKQVASSPEEAPATARLQLAELLFLRGDTAVVHTLLEGDDSGRADAIRAAVEVQQGRWNEAQALFESALKKRQLETGARKYLLPVSLAWMYPLALLAQQTPRHLEAARKFCIGEAGSRKPSPEAAWGVWVHAISVRLGDAALVPTAFDLGTWQGPSLVDLWRCLLKTWLGAEAFSGAERRSPGRVPETALAELRERLQACGFAWLDRQVAEATAVFAGAPPPPGYFATGEQESWRAVLASLEALRSEVVPVATAASATRIVWWIHLDETGAIAEIAPMEQKRGVRGWGRAKSISLTRLAENAKLEPWDAKVARAIRRGAYQRRNTIDRAAAIQALVGHPAVVLADAPDTIVDVVEGTPEMEVVRSGDRYVLRITPEVRTEAPGAYPYYIDAESRRDQEALANITVLRDSPQRIRVIRFTPAQRRAAQLVSGRFAVPATAQGELEQALQALSGHFQIHSDHAQAAREIVAEPRLRAELAPVGDGLTLRLVVAPLGPQGPRLRPGAGRARVMAAVNGESVGTQRDLEQERAHLDEVLAAVEMLDPPAGQDAPCEWLVEEPDLALAMVEKLPHLPAVLAVDWPRGQPVKVISVDTARLSLAVRSERDWFGLQGRVVLDEGRVLELEALVTAAMGSSRFVPMGKGVYAALTSDLRARLAELGSVGDFDGGQLRVPELAAAWLDDVLEGVAAERDKTFEKKLDRLRAAYDIVPEVPGSLQTTMRPYQEDGYVWAMRLANAGFGACLADDMGLGKTIQALGILLARAAGGPALVVAPTSVCGNWLAETQRFAPTLNAVIYGEGDRSATVEAAAAGDVVVVSYTLMQQALETFGAKRWHTLVADEAQAIKNATAKRSLALFDLDADFRMALSGTPIENRLAELWSIMRYCNPGLLGTLSRFNERFAGPIERNRDRDAQRVLRRLIAPFVLRRTKTQVLQELPPRTELVLTIAPEADEAAHYEALRRAAVEAAQKAAASDKAGRAHLNILAQLTRLRRAACDPRLTSPHLGIVGAKVRAFAELAAELSANRHKALVFSQFVDFLTLLRAPLDEAGIRYQYLDGSTPPAERTRRVAAFQAGEGDLFLISLKAGGFGLNLTAADYVVITDPWWNPAAEDQAMGRAHRIGQLRPVTVYRLVAKGTLEERIVELHHDKRALAEGVLAEGSHSTALPSNEELISLMRAG